MEIIILSIMGYILFKFSYAEGRKQGYLDAVKDIIDTGKVKSVEEIYK